MCVCVLLLSRLSVSLSWDLTRGGGEEEENRRGTEGEERTEGKGQYRGMGESKGRREQAAIEGL